MRFISAGIWNAPASGLKFGAALRGLGADVLFYEDSIPLPRQLRLGAAYERQIESAPPEEIPIELAAAPARVSKVEFLTVAADVSLERGTAARLHLGAEYVFQNGFAIRAGYRTGAPLTGGFGYASGAYEIDYAFTPVAELGNAHRASFTLLFSLRMRRMTHFSHDTDRRDKFSAASFFKAILLLIGIAIPFVSIFFADFFAEAKLVRVSMTRTIAPSPSGEWVAFRSEHWDGGEKERTLTLKNLRNGIEYTLTPKYLEIIEAPDPTLIAYLAKDSSLNWYVVGLYYLDEEEREKRDIPHPIPIASMDQGLVKKEIQFSDDGNFLRFFNESDVPFGWKGYMYRTVPDGFWKAEWTPEDFKGVTWFPPKKPSKLPDFMTASQPHIHEKTTPVWSPDEKNIYVHDKDGVWKVNVLMPRMQKWELMLPVKNVEAFSLSPEGRYVFLEIAPDSGVSHPTVKEFDLAGKKPPQARFVGQGRSVMYAGDNRAAFINEGKVYVLDQERTPRQINAKSQPKFGNDASLAWSSDAKRLYVHNEEGVWQVLADSSPDDEWTLALPVENLIAFQLSSSGPTYAYRNPRPRRSPEKG